MRYEIKYLVPQDALPSLRRAVAPYVVLDRFARGYEEKGYTVRSIYLDTTRLTCYYDKLAGLRNRIKVRLRAYNERRGNDRVFLELKKKDEAIIRKHRAPVWFEDLEAFLASGDIETFTIRDDLRFPEARDDAQRFLFQTFRYSLRPSCLVTYEREAFVGRFDPTFRITFDRNLRGRLFPSPTDLYTEQDLRYAFSNAFILEVKFNTRFPAWLRPIIGQFRLSQEALSKYVLCLDLFDRELNGFGRVLSRYPSTYTHTVDAPEERTNQYQDV